LSGLRFDALYLRRLCALIVILGVYSILSMPTDIFPNIDIPVVTLVWSYTGLSAEQMATASFIRASAG